MKEEKICPLKVMKSAAGYYVGRQYEEDGVWLPYDRITDYFQSAYEAEDWLEGFILEVEEMKEG